MYIHPTVDEIRAFQQMAGVSLMEAEQELKAQRLKDAVADATNFDELKAALVLVTENLL